MIGKVAQNSPGDAGAFTSNPPQDEWVNYGFAANSRLHQFLCLSILLRLRFKRPHLPAPYPHQHDQKALRLDGFRYYSNQGREMPRAFGRGASRRLAIAQSNLLSSLDYAYHYGDHCSAKLRWKPYGYVKRTLPLPLKTGCHSAAPLLWQDGTCVAEPKGCSTTTYSVTVARDFVGRGFYSTGR